MTVASGFTANNKVYDGTGVATISTNNVVLDGVISGEEALVTVSTNGYCASFDSVGKGTGISVSVGCFGLAGPGAGNYSLISGVILSADITAKGVSITSGITADDKAYDGNDTATISSNTVVLDGVISGEEADVYLNTNGYTASFDDETVGTDKPVTVSGLTLDGTGAGNYSLSQPAGLTADITGGTTLGLSSSSPTNGYHESVTFTAATTPAEATGSVQFKTNGGGVWLAGDGEQRHGGERCDECAAARDERDCGGIHG